MAAAPPIRDPGNYAQVMRTIRRLWLEGTVEYRLHAVRQMQRRGLTDQDVAALIGNGSIIEHNKPTGTWRWRVQGGCVDGHTASCIVEIEGESNLLIVTVIDEASRKGGKA